MKEVSFKDFEVLARTIFGEAGGESWRGRVAVAHVILNRLKSKKWFSAPTIAEVCQKPWQFSCWNAGDPVREKMMKAAGTSLSGSMAAALDALTGVEKDPTNGATHYYADYIDPPKWAEGKKPTVKIGRHLFFSNID
jgi:N-acetylmuramoyl-L-alanine amidase